MQKVSITSDASLWAELAKRRHENFCSLFLRVASVESTRIYEKLVAKKVKDTPLVTKTRLTCFALIGCTLFNWVSCIADRR